MINLRVNKREFYKLKRKSRAEKDRLIMNIIIIALIIEENIV